MNKIALQSRVSGCVCHGTGEHPRRPGRSGFRARCDHRSLRLTPASGLIKSISELNDGLDYRGGKLRSSCRDLRSDASFDPTLGRLDLEVSLAHKKVGAGAHFLVTQPVFRAEQVESIYGAYRSIAREDLSIPGVLGDSSPSQGRSLILVIIPDRMRSRIEKGRDGVEIALEAYQSLRAIAERSF